MIEIRPLSFAAAHSNPRFAALLEEYAAESAIDGLPKPHCQVEAYQKMEDLGMLHVLGAFRDGELCGFLSMLVTVLPHYGVPVATTESFFVGLEHRKSGAGLMLLRQAQRLAKSLDAVAMIVTAASGRRLAEVLDKTGYVESHRLFFRSLT